MDFQYPLRRWDMKRTESKGLIGIFFSPSHLFLAGSTTEVPIIQSACRASISLSAVLSSGKSTVKIPVTVTGIKCWGVCVFRIVCFQPDPDILDRGVMGQKCYRTFLDMRLWIESIIPQNKGIQLLTNRINQGAAFWVL